MSHDIEIAIDALNVALSLTVLVLLATLVRDILRQGFDVVGARVFLRRQEASQGILLVLASLLLFIASNVLELYGDVFHIDWFVNEVVETASLVPLIAGLLRYHQILRLPSGAAHPAAVEVREAPRG